MSNETKYDVFVCYYELLASDQAATIQAALTERGYRVFVAHLRRPYLSGDFRQIVDSIIKNCKIFVLINGIDALEREEVIRETKIAFPNNNFEQHKFWIFRDNNQEVPRGNDKFTIETNIDLSLQMQMDFTSLPDLARITTIKCKNEKSVGLLGIPDIRAPPVISHKMTVGKTAYNQVNLDDFMRHLQNQIDNKEYDQALETFDTLLRLDPLNVGLFNDKANFLDALGRFEEAIENYSLALSLDKTNPFLLANKANSLEQLEKHDEALKCINESLSIMSNTEFMLTKGNILFNKGEIEKSFKIYEKILSINKNHSKAISAKAAILASEGKSDEAFSLLETAIDKDPKNDNAWYNYGALLLNQGKYDEAMYRFNKSLELNPYNSFSWSAKNRILLKTGKYDDALNVCDEAIRINLNKTIPYFLKGITLFSLERYDEALKCYDEAIKRSSRFPNAVINKALCLLRLNRKEECTRVLNDILGLVVNEPGKLNIIGEILLELNNHDKAEEVFRIARLKQPKDKQLNSNLFLALYNQKKFGDALSICNEIVNELPNDLQFLVNRSSVFIKLERFNEALSDCNKVLEIDKTIGAAYYNKACVNSLQGKRDEALEMLKKSIIYDPRSKEIAKDDEDFKNLSDDSDFKKLIEKK